MAWWTTVHEYLRDMHQAMTDSGVRSDIGESDIRRLGVAHIAGGKAELESAQHAEAASFVATYTRAAGATEIGVFVEEGSIRVRTDGVAATATTGMPMSAGFYEFWGLATISVFYVEASTVTVVSKL